MPTFYMTVGLPGSGKSTFASNIMRARIHSSDQIRHEMFGDSADQSDNNAVFNELHKRVFDDLKNGYDVVYDATNINYKRRRHFLGLLRGLNIKNLTTACLFFVVPYEECVKRNNLRTSPVPEHVIRNMYLSLDIPMKLEGWDSIVIIGDEQKNVKEMFVIASKVEHDNPNHRLTIGQHMLTAGGLLEDVCPNAPVVLRTAVYLHDIGKLFTKKFVDSHGNPSEIAHYYNHDRVGAYESFSYTTHFPEEERLYIALLVRWHMIPFKISRSENAGKTKEKYVNLLGEQTFEDITKIHLCDTAAH